MHSLEIWVVGDGVCAVVAQALFGTLPQQTGNKLHATVGERIVYHAGITASSTATAASAAVSTTTLLGLAVPFQRRPVDSQGYCIHTQTQTQTR